MISSAKTLTVVPSVPHFIGKSCLWVRTAAGPHIGFGHLRRSIILAQSLLDCCQPLFLIDSHDRWSREQLESRGIECICEMLPEILSRLPHPTAILIDTCLPAALDELITYARIRKIPVISIHDLGINPLASDIAVDGSIAPFIHYSSYKPGRAYRGSRYMILDPVYDIHHRQGKHIAREIKSILVNLGGGNARRYFLRVLEGLRLWNRKLRVIGVPGFSSWGQKDLSERDWNPVNFHWEKEAIDQHLVQADLAVTAGGLAAYEALCVGTPLLALSYDHLQRTTVMALARANACVDLGPGDDLNPTDVPDILSKIELDLQKRKMLSANGKRIVDGAGAERVSQIIRGLILNSPATHSQGSWNDSSAHI